MPGIGPAGVCRAGSSAGAGRPAPALPGARPRIAGSAIVGTRPRPRDVAAAASPRPREATDHEKRPLTVTRSPLATRPRRALTGCGGRQDAASTDTGGDVTCEVANDTRIGIATGNATGVYFALGNAYAEQLGATGGKVKATAAETGASVQNIQQLVAGSYRWRSRWPTRPPTRCNGKGSFDGQAADRRRLARIYTNYTQVIVRKGAGITDVADMKGKRVSTGSPKSRHRGHRQPAC